MMSDFSNLTEKEAADKAVKEFVEFYNGLVDESGNITCIHPDDEKIIREDGKLITWDAEKTGFDRKTYFESVLKIRGNKKRVFDNMVPEPFVGDILNAKIICVGINPGTNENTYYDYEEGTDLRNESVSLLSNMTSVSEYGFWPLDPKYEKTGAGFWWYSGIGGGVNGTKKISELIRYLSEKVWKDESLDKDECYNKARKRFAQIFSNFEMYPYHSKEADAKLAHKLKAFEVNKNFFNYYLYPKAERGEVLLIGLWSKSAFKGFENIGNKKENVGFHISKQDGRVPKRINPYLKGDAGQIGRWIVDFIREKNL